MKCEARVEFCRVLPAKTKLLMGNVGWRVNHDSTPTGALKLTGSVRCRNVAYCKGAARGLGEADNCYPHDVWAGTRASGALYYWAILNNGSFEPNSGISETLAFSVR